MIPAILGILLLILIPSVVASLEPKLGKLVDILDKYAPLVCMGFLVILGFVFVGLLYLMEWM